MSLYATEMAQRYPVVLTEMDVDHYISGLPALSGIVLSLSAEQRAMDHETTAAYSYAYTRLKAFVEYGDQGFALSDLTRSPDAASALQGALHELKMGITLGVPLQGLEARVHAFLRASQKAGQAEIPCSTPNALPDPRPRTTPRRNSGTANFFIDDSSGANAFKSLVEPTPDERHTEAMFAPRAAPIVRNGAILQEQRVARHMALLDAVCAECELWDVQHPDLGSSTSAVPALSPASPAGAPARVPCPVVHGPLSQNRLRFCRAVAGSSADRAGAQGDLSTVVAQPTSFRWRGTIMDDHDRHRTQSGSPRSVGTLTPEQYKRPYAL